MILKSEKYVIHVSSTPYHFTWQSNQSISEHLTHRGWKVMFVDPLPKRFPRLSEWSRVVARLRNDPKRAGIMPQQTPEGLTHVLPKLLPDRGVLLRAINRHVLIPRLVHHLRQKAPTVDLMMVSLPTRAALDLIDQVQPKVLVYLCFLNFPADPLAPPDSAATERILAERADLVTLDYALENQERVLQYTLRRPIAPLPVTVDFEHFAPARAPRSPHNPPVCGYFGDIRDNLDSDLLHKVSERYPLVIVGSHTERLQGFAANTRIIPNVPYVRLPEVLEQIDIFLLPYRLDDPYNRGVFPAKAFECLSTGKPTISVGLPSIQPYSHVIDIASSEADFLAKVDQAAQALFTPTEAARREARLETARAFDKETVYDAWLSRLVSVLEEVRSERT